MKIRQSLFNRISSSLAAVAIASAMFAVPVHAEPAKTESGVTKPVAVQQEAAKVDKVNINTADAQTLADHLNGVGIKKAEAIVAYREQNGPFKAADDIVNVTGIGEAILAKNKDTISVN